MGLPTPTAPSIKTIANSVFVCDLCELFAADVECHVKLYQAFCLMIF